jgi:hypothetical protein
MLLIVLLLADDNIAVNKDIIKEKVLARLWPLPAHLRQYAFTNENAIWSRERLS